MFYDILARACTEIKILSFWTRKWPRYIFRLFNFWIFFFRFFFFLLFFSFCCSDWPSSGLACSLKSSKKASSRGGKFDHGVAMCRGRKFCSKFFTQCLSIYVHISGSIRPITLIWASLERSFPPAEAEYRWRQFRSKVMTSEVEARSRLIIAGNSRHGSQWVNQIYHFPKQSSATEQYFRFSVL